MKPAKTQHNSGQLSIQGLNAAVADYVQANKTSKNTQSNYARAQAQFLKFKSEVGFEDWTDAAVAFVVYLRQKGYKATSVAAKAAAIKAGFEIDAARLSEAVGATQRAGVDDVKQAPALTAEAIEASASMVDAQTYHFFVLAFLGGFRYSELLNIRVEDVCFEGPKAIVSIRKSKTDQKGQGQQKAFFLNRKNQNFCGVTALALQTEGKAAGGKIFAISKNTLIKRVKETFGDAFSLHSFRAGFVTEALRRGASDSQVMKQTGHKSATTLRRYDRTRIFENNAVGLFIQE